MNEYYLLRALVAVGWAGFVVLAMMVCSLAQNVDELLKIIVKLKKELEDAQKVIDDRTAAERDCVLTVVQENEETTEGTGGTPTNTSVHTRD